MKPNRPLKEIIIVAGVFIILWVISFLLIGPLFGNSSLDINIQDTFAITGPMFTNSIIPAFLWLITVGYLIRSAINKFKVRIQNIILLVSCAGLNILMLNYLQEISMYSGMTLNQPISGSHLQKNISPNYDSMVKTSFVIQVILILLLTIIAAITAKNWNVNKDVR